MQDTFWRYSVDGEEKQDIWVRFEPKQYKYKIMKLFSCWVLLVITWLICASHEICESVPNCSQCFNNQVCDECLQGYIWNDARCVSVTDDSFNGQPSQGTYFATSQTLTFSGIGGNPLDMCGFYVLELGICAFCNEGYILILGKCRQKINKCEEWADDGRCLKCIDNLMLDVNGLCVDLNCQKNGYYNCQVCHHGFIKNYYDMCLDPNCKTYQNGRCQLCTNTFHQVPGQELCVKITDNTTNNTTNNSNTTTTIITNSTTTETNISSNSSNTETNITTNTTNENNGSTTIIIVTNVTNKTTIINNQTTTITQIITISFGCQLLDLRGGCRKCLTGYYLRNGLCQAPDPFCRVYDPDNGTCYVCQPNYQLINQNCVSNDPQQNCLLVEGNQCRQCVDKYYLLAGVCLQIDPSCLTYDQSTGGCLSCLEGYRLVGSKCLLIFSLSTGQDDDEDNFNSNRVSQFSKYYCLEYEDNSDYCLICYARFYAKDGLCWRVNPLCRTYDNSAGTCRTCYQGYQLSEGSCLVDLSTSAQANCREYNPLTQLCEKCMNRYFLFDGICLQVYPECKDYDHTNGNCVTCFNGYFLLEGQCQIVATGLSVPFCQNYNPLDPRQCLKCVSGYYLKLNRCLRVSETCRDYDENTGMCESCISSNYMLESGKCITLQQKYPHCVQFNRERQCTQCEEEYSLTSEGSCITE